MGYQLFDILSLITLRSLTNTNHYSNVDNRHVFRDQFALVVSYGVFGAISIVSLILSYILLWRHANTASTQMHADLLNGNL